MSAVPSTVRIGSRKSELAMIQSNTIKAALEQLYPAVKFELLTMATIGDKIQDRALSKIGEKSLFTKELEIALEENQVDLVVHSLKDLPTTLPAGMTIGAIYRRDSPYDAVVLSQKHAGKTLATLPSGSTVGTSSLRRIAQLKRAFPHLNFKDVRGNLNTRLKKLDEDGIYDALILAEAGLDRMGWTSRVSEILPSSVALYAVGQGALAIECRENDAATLSLIQPLQDHTTMLVCRAERAFMRSLEGGCSVPLGVHSSLAPETKQLSLTGAVFSLDGKNSLASSVQRTVSSPEDADAVGAALAQVLLEAGAAAILQAARNETHGHSNPQEAPKKSG